MGNHAGLFSLNNHPAWATMRGFLVSTCNQPRDYSFLKSQGFLLSKNQDKTHENL
jgi:hypothetical protein